MFLLQIRTSLQCPIVITVSWHRPQDFTRLLSFGRLCLVVLRGHNLSFQNALDKVFHALGDVFGVLTPHAYAPARQKLNSARARASLAGHRRHLFDRTRNQICSVSEAGGKLCGVAGSRRPLALVTAARSRGLYDAPRKLDRELKCKGAPYFRQSSPCSRAHLLTPPTGLCHSPGSNQNTVTFTFKYFFGF